MAMGKVKVSQSHERLMLAIGEAIRVQTTISPMTAEDILGVLGFTLGSAVARAGKNTGQRKQYRDMAVANVDLGLDAMVRNMQTEILMPGVQ